MLCLPLPFPASERPTFPLPVQCLSDDASNFPLRVLSTNLAHFQARDISARLPKLHSRIFILSPIAASFANNHTIHSLSIGNPRGISAGQSSDIRRSALVTTKSLT